MKYSIILVTALLIGACASKSDRITQDEPEKLEKTLNTSTGDKNERVGVRGKDIVVQKKVYLEDTMTKAQDDIADLENGIYGSSRGNPGGLWVKLQDCRKRVADARIGGNGIPDAMEKWEKISESDPDVKYRVDESNNVVAVSEEELIGRIDRLSKTKSTLQRRHSDYQDKLDACETKYSSTLVQSGFSPEDAKSRGEWVEGPNGFKVWKMTRPATTDPEELMRRKEQRQNASTN